MGWGGGAGDGESPGQRAQPGQERTQHGSLHKGNEVLGGDVRAEFRGLAVWHEKTVHRLLVLVWGETGTVPLLI